MVSNCFRVWIGTVKPYKPSCAEFHAIPPGRCFGIYTGACDRVEDVLGPIRAGERLEVVAEDYGVPVSQLRDAYAIGA